MFVGTIFLLFVCFIESVILNFDFRWQRLSYALKAATFGSKRFPDGRNLFPQFLCRLDFHVMVPLATGGLCVYQLVNVGGKQYGGYPTSLLAWGWTLLAICIVIVFLTIVKNGRTKSELPAIEDDPKFKSVPELVQESFDEEVKIDQTQSERPAIEDDPKVKSVLEEVQEPVDEEMAQPSETETLN